jgi:hypothetical protein
MTRTPSFLYIGTSKAGTTWLFNLLDSHRDVYMAPGKGTYFFDQHYDRGMDWYLGQFRDAGKARAVGEISHSYLYSAAACKRIAATNWNVQLLLCLREPADRAFSSYLDHVKNGKFQGSFELALERFEVIADHGRYATYLAPWVEQFGKERIHAGMFEELSADPQVFAAKVFDFLRVSRIELTGDLLAKRMPAGRPRSRALSRLAKSVSRTARRLGLSGMVGKAKKSVAIRSVLYQPYGDHDRPRMSDETRGRLRERFASEVARLDTLLNADFGRRWGYA